MSPEARVAIEAHGLSKRYRIGVREQRADTLAGRIGQLVTMPVRNFRRLRRLTSFAGESTEHDVIWALHDVSFRQAEGEALGIIGRNGAGKSTLLKVLSRITEPTAGEAVVRGRVASLLEVGTGFHPELTGRENVYLNGTLLGMSKAEIDQRFEEIVEFAEVGPFVDTPVKRYSSGMKVRLAFSVAAHLEAEILIVDEVLAVGDVGFQKKCLGKMSGAASSGRTVLFVTHNMALLERLCPRTILLDGGRVIRDGPTDEVVAEYLRLTEDGQFEGGELGVFDLTERHNPLGDHAIQIRRLRLLDSEGRPRATFQMGEPLSMEIELDGLGLVRDSQVGITVKSLQNQWLASINSGMTCRFEGQRSRREIARLEIPRLPLTPGTYVVEVQTALQGTGLLDRVEEAGRFDVVEADVYGSGYAVTSYFGVFYLDGQWRIRPRDAETAEVP